MNAETIEKQAKSTISALVCAIIIVAFLAVGFAVMLAQFFGKPVEIPGEWLAAMLSLASTALGFLAGEKKGDNNNKCRCQNCCSYNGVKHTSVQ